MLVIMGPQLTLVTEVAPDQPVTSARQRSWLRAVLVAIAVAAVLALMAWCENGEQRAIRQLPAAERQAFFTRTLQSFRSVCTAPAEALRDHCDGQARLLLEFPECDDACRDLASGRLSRAPQPWAEPERARTSGPR
jgi:hypothetical protein